MKRILFAVFLLLGCLSIHAEPVYYGFKELSLDESFVYRFVKAMDAESQKAVEDILAGKNETEDQSIIKRAQDEWYVRKDHLLPDGNYYESAFYKEKDGNLNIILPTIEVIMEKDASIDELLELLGNRVTILGNEENAYYLGCQVKTSEEVLELCLLIYGCAYEYGIHGVKRFKADTYTLNSISDPYLISRLKDSYQPFVPKHEGEVLLYEMDWQGVDYNGGWVDYFSADTESYWSAEGTDEGLAITVHTKQGQIWQPQVMVVPDVFPLEAGRNYIVRLTLKVPSDGIYQVNLGSWAANTQYQTPVTASDEWQEIDVDFQQFGLGEGWLNSGDADSRNYLNPCHVLLQCGWMVGTTIVKKVQVIEQTKSDTTDVNNEEPINDDREDTQDKKLIFEKNWEGVEYSEWLTDDIVPDWTYEATDEGLVITNPHIQNQWWHPLVQCGGDNDFSLEEGHDYFVRLTMKVPSDGIYKVVLGDWSTLPSWYAEVSETPSDNWQVIDVEFSNFYTAIPNAQVYLYIGDVVGTTILKKVQVYERTTQDTYRPFVEDGKVWKVGDIWSGNPVRRVEYYYFDGDTIIDGKTCKQMMCQRYVSPDHPDYEDYKQFPILSYVGAYYEEDKKVYMYNSSNQFKLMYDFSINSNDTLWINNNLWPYVVEQRQTGGIKGFKGVHRDVMMCVGENRSYNTTWLEGVGCIDGPIYNVYYGQEGHALFLMACAVGDEVIYFNDEYEDGATPDDIAGARKSRFDFTHITKTKPKTRSKQEESDARISSSECDVARPKVKTRMRSGEEQSLYGEYNEQQLSINLSPINDAYQVCITDESGNAVYEKAINTGSIVGLNIDISAYAEGRYTVTVENSNESFIGEFNAQTTGIKEVRTKKEETRMYIYNLQGQKVDASYKGIVIQNGKKRIAR